jgi:hypothetical protein
MQPVNSNRCIEAVRDRLISAAAQVSGTRSRRKRCGHPVPPGTLSSGAHTTTNSVVSRGRFSRSKELEPGRYTLTLTAINAAGEHSAPVSMGFTIAK